MVSLTFTTTKNAEKHLRKAAHSAQWVSRSYRPRCTRMPDCCKMYLGTQKEVIQYLSGPQKTRVITFTTTARYPWDIELLFSILFGPILNSPNKKAAHVRLFWTITKSYLFKRSLSVCEGRNFTTTAAGTCTCSPVFGFRATRA